MNAAGQPHVVVIGGGITGLAAAHRVAVDGRCAVTVRESESGVGGRIRSTDFAGVHGIDEGADAFLARVPDAVDLAREVGLGGELVHPEAVSAAVWHDGLHRIPDGLLLGVPRRLVPLARTSLLSTRGKARAALEPLLPRSATDHDSIGRLIRARFGDEVHDRIVDALVGSIYATDTDDSSLAEVPQLAELARSRSLLLAARRAPAAGTATAASAPVFAAPRGGVQRLAQATQASIEELGGTILSGDPAREITREGSRWLVDDQPADAVIIATPARAAADLVESAAADAVAPLRAAETADVVMLTMHVGDDQWPDPLRGLSGYLVPKSVQRAVTAASFGSQKWAHWAPPRGGQVLRVSLGRDGAPVLDRSDEHLVDEALADLNLHLGVEFTPLDVRVTRWEGAFPQYRPHHAQWLDAVSTALPDGLFVAGAPYRGIGIPACVRDGRSAGDLATAHARALAD